MPRAVHKAFGVDQEAAPAGYPQRLGLIDWSAVRRRAEQALDALHLSIDPRARVAELPIACRTTVAVARAHALSANLVVLDEPTTSLSAPELRLLLDRMNLALPAWPRPRIAAAALPSAPL